jgi:hypothetical protein
MNCRRVVFMYFFFVVGVLWLWYETELIVVKGHLALS